MRTVPQLAAAAAVILAVAIAPAGAVEAGYGGPWPADVEGHVPPKPGEHPRLLFRRGDLAALRRRAKTPAGRALLKRLRVLLNGGDGESMPKVRRPLDAPYGDRSKPIEQPVGAYSMSHAAGYGLLYQLTGDRKYAEFGRQCFEWAFEGYRDRDGKARYSFKKPYGALRAGPSLGWYAVGYDLCCDGWDEASRRKVAAAIQNYNEGRNMSLAELVRGSRHMPGSNHWGMQVGGGALAVLAILNDPGVDTGKIVPLLEVSRKSMIRNLTEGFGDHGWFAEGDGTGSMSSHIVFTAALQAWKVAGGKDFISPRPNAPWMTLKWIFLTVPRAGRMDFPKRGAYPHNVWARDGLSGAGYFGEGFGGVTDAQKSALLWFYNRHLKAQDDKNGAPFDTPSPYPHFTVLSFVNWPFGLKPRNPIETVPPAAGDEKYGFYMFRNRWQDENDVVVSVQTRSTRGWHRARSGGEVTVWGLGRKARWGRVRWPVKRFQPAGDGSGILTAGDGTCLAVDFSKASGTDAMLVMTGPGAPGGQTVTAGGATFSFKFLTSGTAPTPQARGDKVVIGGQTVAVADGHIVLGRMAGPWKPAK